PLPRATGRPRLRGPIQDGRQDKSSMRRRWGALLIAGALMAGGLVQASAQGGRPGGTLRAGLDADPPTLDPHRSGSAVDRQVFQNLFDKLVDVDDSLAIVPMLATSWAISADGRTVTLRLRQGVTFHDGTPFNADAVKANFDRMQDPKFPSARRSEIRPVENVVAADSSTVQLVLERRYDPLLFVPTDLARLMVPPAASEIARLDCGVDHVRPR